MGGEAYGSPLKAATPAWTTPSACPSPVVTKRNCSPCATAASLPLCPRVAASARSTIAKRISRPGDKPLTPYQGGGDTSTEFLADQPTLERWRAVPGQAQDASCLHRRRRTLPHD